MSEDVIEVFLVLGAIAIALLVALWLSRRNKRRKAPAKSRHRYIQDSAVAYLAGAEGREHGPFRMKIGDPPKGDD